MKKVCLLAIMLIVSVVTFSQRKDAIYGSVGATSAGHLLIPQASAGVAFKLNEIEFNFQGYRPGKVIDAIPDNVIEKVIKHLPNAWKERVQNALDRENKIQVWGSIGYTRVVPIVPNFSFRPSAKVGLNISGSDVDPRIGAAIGAGFGLNLGQHCMFSTITDFPVIEKQKGNVAYGKVQYGLKFTYYMFGGK